jgi:hypothetical protein
MIALGLALSACNASTPPPAAQMAQYPSPMEEHARAHRRIEPPAEPGVRIEVTGILAQPVEVFPTRPAEEDGALGLLIHFHGAAYVPAYAGRESARIDAVVVVNLGSGSGVYERAFPTAAVFGRLVAAVRDSLAARRAQPVAVERIYLSSFSAGYGAVRGLLRQPATVERLDGIVLLDGLHTDYVPDRRVLAEGGGLNTEKLAPFLAYAREAEAGRTSLVVTHSEIFPGNYASTTETADYLLGELGLSRTPVLRWGPVGMQQVSEARAGRFSLLGFAGNTAPDHVDHFHALPELLAILTAER